jgi:hypothetical protein
LVLPWLVDRVILPVKVLDREAHGDRLQIRRVSLLAGMVLACLGRRLVDAGVPGQRQVPASASAPAAYPVPDSD